MIYRYQSSTRLRVFAVLAGLAFFAAMPGAGLHAAPTIMPSQAASPAATLDLMQRVADWQLSHPSRHPEDDWTQAVGDAGMMALAGISGQPRYRDAMLAMGEHNEWKLGPRPYHADDHIVGQTYAELYALLRDPRMIAPMRARFDAILRDPHDGPLDWDAPQVPDRWSWCDSLFMGPPAWARLAAVTGDQRYLDFAIRQWWKTSDYLYDKDEHLFFRDSRFFKQREANGRKVFWGRGNGWVLGGLVRLLEYIPANHPLRARFERQYTEMAERLLTLQQADGMWRASLLDPAAYPLQETSGTALYAYALAYGVNQGLLDRKRFAPAVREAWEALTAQVAPDGKLTHVQPIGEDPKHFTADSTEVYGVGAFLLAGSEVYRMQLLAQTKPATITVSNDGTLPRLDELAEVANSGAVAVMDAAATRIVPSQQLGGKLLFQVSLMPQETRRYLVLPRAVVPSVPPVQARVHARFVPERLDDFAWESDRTAHRVYGPAIMTDPKEHLVSSGIDVWSKRTRALVIDKWYAGGEYHLDRGEGLDFYHVGQSRGCGGLGVYDNGAFYPSSNFSHWKVLADGPLRAVFELSYDRWAAGSRSVAEQRRISIDAGSNFSRMESVFTFSGRPIDIGIGIVQRAGGGEYAEGAGWMSYWEPQHGDDGSDACAIVADGRYATHNGQYLSLVKVESGKPLVYYMGAGWSKSGDFPNAQAWEQYVRGFQAGLARPLQVTVEP
jgi:rhamnogalacturonyl hydrolase YesR/predicted transcriptional regulator